jgi:hypothetical protein
MSTYTRTYCTVIPQEWYSLPLYDMGDATDSHGVSRPPSSGGVLALPFAIEAV